MNEFVPLLPYHHYHHRRHHHHHHQHCDLLSTAAGEVDSSSCSVLKVFEEAWARKVSEDPNPSIEHPHAADPEGHGILAPFLDCFRHFWTALEEQVATASVTNSGPKTMVPMEHCGGETG